MPYIDETMFTKLTTYFLLTAIALQGVFGGLQESVSICLGGGHEHDVAEVVEHCEFECSHHGDFVTPTINESHISNCGCTDFELGLIALLAAPRENDCAALIAPIFTSSVTLANEVCYKTCKETMRRDDDIGMMHRISIIRSTRLRV